MSISVTRGRKTILQKNSIPQHAPGQRSCPVCLSEGTKAGHQTQSMALRICCDCSFCWDEGAPLNPTALYQASYFNNDGAHHGYANYFESMQFHARTFRHRLLRARHFAPTANSLLDVGCALGECLSVAKQLGWERVHGLDVSDYAVQFAEKRDLSVEKGTLLTTRLARATFDVVLLQDMIEHVHSPVDYLRSANELLKPNGILLIVTPDIGGFWHRLLGAKWYHFKPGEHLCFFSRRSLTLALKQSGFEVLQASTSLHYLGIGYILSRLKGYSPRFFSILIRLATRLHLDQFGLWIPIDELEVWARKNDESPALAKSM